MVLVRHKHSVRMGSHLALAMLLVGIAQNDGYSTHSLAKFSTNFCFANTDTIAKSSV